MRRKKISPSLVYVLHKTWNLAFSCPGRAVMAKKMYKKRAELLLCLDSFQPIAFLTFSLSSPWHLKVRNDDSFMLSLLVNYYKTPAQPLIRANLYSRDTCFGPEGVPWIAVSLYLFYLLLQVYVFLFQSSLNNFLWFALWACWFSWSVLSWKPLITKTFLCSTVQVKYNTTPNSIAWKLKWCDSGRYCQVKLTLCYKVILQVLLSQCDTYQWGTYWQFRLGRFLIRFLPLISMKDIKDCW